MKKIILILGLLSLCSFIFARPIFQQDVLGPGLFTEYDKSAFNKTDPAYFGSEFQPFFGFNGAIIWEFNSSNGKDFHFYTGLETGLEGIGIPLSILGGFSYKLFDLDWATIELNSTIQGGCMFPIIDYYYFAYIKTAFDIVMMKPNRRGLYGGIGITDFILPDIYLYKDYGASVFLLNYAGVHVVAGFRF